MDEKEEINNIVASQSKMLGSRPAKLYLTDNKIIIGEQEIEKNQIKNLQMIEDNRTDYRSVGVILMNTIIGMFLAYSLTTYLPISILVVGLSSLLGYLVVRFVRKKPYGYVSLETDKAEYRFGIADPISAAEFFGDVYNHMDKDLEPKNFAPDKISNDK
jgi:hypothetical protein